LSSWTVNIADIKEVRPGKLSKDFETSAGSEAKKCDSTKCFIIFYGNEFRLKTLSVESKIGRVTDHGILSLLNLKSLVFSGNTIALSRDYVENWIKGLNLLIKEHKLSYLQKLDVWMLKLFETVTNSTGQ
jgi:hypothetical protein